MADENYDVGYGKPPLATRFSKGRSGNPKGRPKGSTNLLTQFQKGLNETIVITNDGTKKKVRVSEALLKRLVQMALSGNLKALVECLKLSLLVDESDAGGLNTSQDDALHKKMILSLMKTSERISDEAAKPLPGRKEEFINVIE